MQAQVQRPVRRGDQVGGVGQAQPLWDRLPVPAGGDPGLEAEHLAQGHVDAAEARADGRGDGALEGDLVPADALEHVLRERWNGSAADREDPEDGGVRALQADLRRACVRQVDRGDIVPACARLRGIRIAHHRAPGETQIARVERRAVRPRDALAKVQEQRLTVARDAAVRVRRHFGREFRDQFAAFVVAEDGREQQGGRFVGGGRVREHRIEAIGLVRIAHAQAPALGPGVLRAALRRLRLDLRAAG